MITSEEMRELEEEAIEDGLSREEMMENAGKGVAEFIQENYDLDKYCVLVFAGEGNNGGDGLVAARYLADKCPVTVLVVNGELSELCEENLKKLVGKVEIRRIDERNIDRVRMNCPNAILVDALLGMGLDGELRRPYDSIVEWYNEMGGIKISLDVPTGIDCDTGEIFDDLRADFDQLLTFHDMKAGLESYEDKTEVIGIGID